MISPSHFQTLLQSQVSHPILRRECLEINKAMGEKARSYGSLAVQVNQAQLHDRLILGGNSKIWGGFFDTQNVPLALMNKLEHRGIRYEALSFAKTGSISNVSSIGQLQEMNGKTIDAGKLLGGSVLDQYVTTIQIQPNSHIEIQSTSPGFQLESQRVILAISPIQLIDLLYRSAYIRDGDLITLSEYEHTLSPVWAKDPYQFDTVNTVIRYKPSRAVAHFLGIQKNPSSMEPSNKWLKPFIDQQFGQHQNTLELVIQGGVLREVKTFENHPSKFGSSIHYCNLHINHQNINDFLHTISPNLIGVGMAFVKQSTAGPISNDILLDAANKLITK